MSQKKRLPIAPFEKILKDAGAKRVSKSAAREFAFIAEEICDSIAIDAVKLSKHANRKTILAADLKMAKR